LRILLFLFICISYLFSTEYSFSLDSGSINIKKSDKIVVMFNRPIFKLNGELIDDAYTQKFIILKEDNASGSTVKFTSKYNFDQNKIFVNISNPKSEQVYLLLVDGTKIKLQEGDIFPTKSISFKMKRFTDLVFPSSLDMSIGGSSIFTVKLNSQPDSDTKVDLVSSDKNILVFPSSIIFTSSNYENGVKVRIQSNDKLKTDIKYSIMISSLELGVSRSLLVVLKDMNIDFMISEFKNEMFNNKTQTFKIRLIKPIINDYVVKISSTNSSIKITPSSLIFTKDNYKVDKKVSLEASLLTKETNEKIKFTSRDSNKEMSVKIKIAKIKDVNNTVSLIKTSSLFSSISWKKAPEYKGKYQVFKGKDKSNLVKVSDTNLTTTIIPHKPNEIYILKVGYGSDVIGYLDIKSTNVSLKDSDSDGITDDLEGLFSITNSSPDKDSNKIPDIISSFLFNLDNLKDKNLSKYTFVSDRDGDKMGDILELSVGRNPFKKDDMNNPIISIDSDGKRIFINSFSELISKSKVKISGKHSPKLEAYIGSACVQNDILVSNYFSLANCKKLSSMAVKNSNYEVIWIGSNNNGDIVFQKQVLSIFKSSPVEDISNVLVFNVFDRNYSIKTSSSNKISFGSKSSTKGYKNPILEVLDVPKSDYKFINGIFDLKISNVTSHAIIVISQPIALSYGSSFVVLKDSNYSFFDTSSDEISSSFGSNSDCSLDDLYSRGLSEDRYCVKLKIKDGGANDLDKTNNGIILIQGGVIQGSDFISINDKPSGCSSLHASEFKKATPSIDYLMIFMFLMSSVWMIKIFRRDIE